MEGLFKLIIYVIIFIVWSAAQAKKKERWDEKIPNFPTTPKPKPKTDNYHPPQKPYQQKAKWEMDEASLAYQRNLEMRKNKHHSPAPTRHQVPGREGVFPEEVKIKKPSKPVFKEPVVINNPQELKLEPVKIDIPLRSVAAKVEKKAYYHLKSPAKEGIIWSIILGSPRAHKTYSKIL